MTVREIYVVLNFGIPIAAFTSRSLAEAYREIQAATGGHTIRLVRLLEDVC